MGKCRVRFLRLLPCAAQGIVCRAADSDHLSDPVHDIEGRDGEIECSQTDRSGAERDKKGIG